MVARTRNNCARGSVPGLASRRRGSGKHHVDKTVEKCFVKWQVDDHRALHNRTGDQLHNQGGVDVASNLSALDGTANGSFELMNLSVQ
jgi:hypothetical protein